MSLLHRVSSLESFSQERGRSLSVSSQRHRKLSFSPLPGAWGLPSEDDDEEEVTQEIGAFEVPKGTRVCRFTQLTSLQVHGPKLMNESSASRNCRDILPPCSRNCLWVCRH
jgi:hypothetical protein